MRRPPAVARVLERVIQTVRRHGMLREGDLVLVCVSGGPDSVCLIESLVRLRRLFKLRIEVFHLDHGLRDASAADAAYVQRLANRLRLPFHLRVLSDQPPKGASSEAWASAARSREAMDVAAAVGATAIAEGHTMNDQAETVIMALVRGGGLEAVAGIWPLIEDEPGPRVVQPLLDVGRTEVEAFCRALGLRPRHDESNRDKTLLRNAIRLDAMPALERATRRSVIEPIARSAALLDSDRKELRRAAGAAHQGFTRTATGEFRIRASDLRAIPASVASRAIRAVAYERLGPDGAPWSKRVIDSVLELASARTGSRLDLPGGSTAWRDREYVHIARAFPEGEP